MHMASIYVKWSRFTYNQTCDFVFLYNPLCLKNWLWYIKIMYPVGQRKYLVNLCVNTGVFVEK